jgi:hypothetical protein
LICEDTDKIDIRKLWLKGFPGLWMDGVLIPIVTTECHFGGERRWFLCPDCGRRCAVLYKPDYRCRLCRKGRYLAEPLTTVDRKLLTARKLRQRLGQYPPDPSEPIAPKPPRMHWATYERIRAKIEKLELDAILISRAQFLRRYPPLK